MARPHENRREDVVGRSSVEDTSALLACCDDLKKHQAGALWTDVSKIEPESQS